MLPPKTRLVDRILTPHMLPRPVADARYQYNILYTTANLSSTTGFQFILLTVCIIFHSRYRKFCYYAQRKDNNWICCEYEIRRDRYEQGNINICVVEKGKNIFETTKSDNITNHQLQSIIKHRNQLQMTMIYITLKTKIVEKIVILFLIHVIPINLIIIVSLFSNLNIFFK